MLSPDAGSPFLMVPIALGMLIVSAYPILKMIGWWMDGGAEPLLALISIMLYAVLIVVAATSSPGVAMLIFLLILVSAIAAPFIGQLSDQTQLAKIDEDRLKQFSAALEADPNNAVARMALAELLYKRGQHDEAIEHMTWTLDHNPGLKMRIRPQLDSWLRAKERENMAMPTVCHRCHKENDPGAKLCAHCGAEFGTKAGIMQRIAEEGGPKVVIRGWIVSATVVTVILFVLLCGLPSIVAAPIILALLIVGVWLFLRWVGGDLGTHPF